MSTRATILIREQENKEIWIYHHCDGYPTGVGEDLSKYLLSVNFWDSEEIANDLIKGECENDLTYEITTCQHGDEDYAYLIDCDNKILTCYKVGWDEFEWKDNKIEFITDYNKIEELQKCKEDFNYFKKHYIEYYVK